MAPHYLTIFVLEIAKYDGFTGRIAVFSGRETVIFNENSCLF
jgi:hypothetical protein